MATDPVCGMMVDERSAAGTAAFGGRNYYFCSEKCRADFEADPVNFANKSEPVHAHSEYRTHTAIASKEPSPAQGSKYTCPMHPEIVRDAPGSCP
ncbi:MAG: YHS domain-containing protein, partial [Pseudomonadota bacterium]